eukprot:scaffold975_cov63-Phaeocystis_antarctica.AAC.10
MVGACLRGVRACSAKPVESRATCVATGGHAEAAPPRLRPSGVPLCPTGCNPRGRAAVRLEFLVSFGDPREASLSARPLRTFEDRCRSRSPAVPRAASRGHEIEDLGQRLPVDAAALVDELAHERRGGQLEWPAAVGLGLKDGHPIHLELPARLKVEGEAALRHVRVARNLHVVHRPVADVLDGLDPLEHVVRERRDE